MASKKFYAVKVGVETGIYKTWDECKARVTGYPGAEFKGFAIEADALSYLGGEVKIEKKIEVKVEKEENEEVIQLPIIFEKGMAIAYVDGSFNEDINTYGSGVIILYEGKEYEFASCGKDENLVEMRNVAGEIKASEMAMKWCVDNNVKKLLICYDYKGIELWCTNVWKAKKIGTKAYKLFYEGIKDRVDVTFRKIKAHSGDKYNEIADGLAASMIS